MYSGAQEPVRKSSLRPILKPGGPRWIGLLAEPRTDAKFVLTQVGVALGTVAAFVAIIAGISWIGSSSPVLASLLLAGLIGAGFAAGVAGMRQLDAKAVRGPAWEYEGVSIKGEGLALLEDIDSRFRYAERMIGEVPTGIDWNEISGEVRTLMWECAGHAARLSALDTEISEMRYAARGTPQAAFKRSLEERRSEHHNLLKDAQLEADALAGVAGNAAAAAKIALLKTGSLAALEVVTPTAQGLAARSALRDARARLELLAEVWSQLDESNTVRAEQLDADRARQLESKRSRRRTG